MASPPYGDCLEFGGAGVEVRNSQIWAGNGEAFNCDANLGATGHSYIYCNNVTVNQTHVAPTQKYVNDMFSCLGNWSGVSYTLWNNCSFNVTGMNNAFGEVGYPLTGCCYNVFNNCTITGTTNYPDYVYADSTCVDDVWP